MSTVKKPKTKKTGKILRLDYEKNRDNFEIPDLLGIQLKSYESFLSGINDSFKEFFPITQNNYTVDVVSSRLAYEEVTYGAEECKKRGLNLEVPLKATVSLHNLEKDEIMHEEVTVCQLPVMTDKGTFIINGSEKIVINQMVRSPGAYFKREINKQGKELYTAQIVPARGVWTEFIHKNAKDTLWVRIDRDKPAVPATMLLRASGLTHDYMYGDKFGDSELIKNTMEEDTADTLNKACVEIYRKLTASENKTVLVREAVKYVQGALFNESRYTLDAAGRHKLNGKMALKERITGTVLAKDVTSMITGETVCRSGTVITEEDAEKIQDSGCDTVTVRKGDRLIKVVSNCMVNPSSFGEDFAAEKTDKKVYFPYAQKLYENGKRNLTKAEINALIPKSLTPDDIYAVTGYLLNLSEGLGTTDNIDSLTNKRIRHVGEIIGIYFRRGLGELRKNVISVLGRKYNGENGEEKILTPKDVVNPRATNGALKEFFGSTDSRVQILDHDNPLSEVSNVRRVTSEGTGGVKSKNAGFEIRDIHSSQYAKICPVETPEGQKIGIVTNLAVCALADEYGFLMAPYRKVDKTDPDNPVVTDETVYLNADEEERYVIAQAGEELDKDGHFAKNTVLCHKGEITAEYDKTQVDYMDATPKSLFSVTANVIPFLQNDDANRALMGCSMMKQAVPLLFSDSPVVSTGMDERVARDSRECVIAEKDGIVKDVDSTTVTVTGKDGKDTEYSLYKFQKTQTTGRQTMNQRPNVNPGEKVKAGDIIADGPAIKNGELALGNNPLIGFMEWEGYNYEDAVLISERLVKEDVYTSLHIFEYTCEVREVDKLGVEQITADMPGLSAYETRNLDEEGIVRIGAEVKEHDVLVGKITPRNPDETVRVDRKVENTTYGQRERKVKNTPLRLPHGMHGTVIDINRYSEIKGDKLGADVIEKVVIYVAQKRKIQVGDKMAGRHGNKGIVSRVLPVEDMPYLENGRPLDIVLNPLGVPSRMNIGQILELHLGLAADMLGIKTVTPVFNGATEEDIKLLMETAKDFVGMDEKSFLKKHGKDYPKEVIRMYNPEAGKKWKGVNIQDGYKAYVYDGRTGQRLPNPISVGFMHYLKLHHMAEDKMAARSIGSYSQVTQQPLGGKARNGGQRLGEMETWALEAHGAATVLQEMLTVKSDDVVGRTRACSAIMNGTDFPESGVTESFRVLVKTLQCAGLNVTLYDSNAETLSLKAEIVNLDKNRLLSSKFGLGKTEKSEDDENTEYSGITEEDYAKIDEAFGEYDTDLEAGDFEGYSLYDGEQEE